MGKNRWILPVVIGVIAVLLLVVPLIWGWTQNYEYTPRLWYHGMGPGMMFGYGGGWYMGIFMLVFWGLVIWGIIMLVRHYGRRPLYSGRHNSAQEILDRRYAQGEIDKAEYEEKKKTLYRDYE